MGEKQPQSQKTHFVRNGSKMLPLLILVVPPSVAAGSYASWSLGQRVVVVSRRLSDPPEDTFASYSSGLVALAGTYGAFEFALSQGEFATKESSVSQKASARRKAKFEPPKTIGDLVGRIGRPVLMRLGGAYAAFFCAGLLQTYVASSSSLGTSD